MARWSDLTKAQQDAILAFTREGPNGKPNGPAEVAFLRMANLLHDNQHTPLVCALQRAFVDMGEAEADQIRALRLAFGLDVDGVTPIDAPRDA